ncbi:MAG: hypothetical protein RJB38_1466 [Pseudomonadota bacterium]|jgi:phospholipid/cholesterol/gamma-HCH transport system substrate-binding protein
MNTKKQEIRTGLFALIGVGLFISAVLMLGGGSGWLTKQRFFFAHFESVDGLIPGAKVVFSGLQVGTVNELFIDAGTKDVAVKLAVTEKFGDLIREGTTAEIATMGVLGDKFVRLNPGPTEAPPLANRSRIEVRSGKDLSQFLNRGDQLLVTLNNIAGSMDRLIKGFEKGHRADQIAEGLAATAKNLASASSKLNHELDELEFKQAVKNLNAILEKINQGRGTLGALINDPALYDDAKALVGGANRNRIVRNLVRQTIQKGESSDTK